MKRVLLCRTCLWAFKDRDRDGDVSYHCKNKPAVPALFDEPPSRRVYSWDKVPSCDFYEKGKPECIAKTA